jgi:8-oxo-dGTP pyrophosphatase MutT (NUDIX family)
MKSDLHQRLIRALRKVSPNTSDFDLNPDVDLPAGRKLRDAGVLIAIVDRPGDGRLILTKRSSVLKHHPGQIAFPGGKVDAGDDGPVAAALREAEEEIGLPRDAVHVLGTLPPHETVTGFRATPVVSLVPDGFTIVPEPGEVDEVFDVPLSHVIELSRYAIQSRRWRGQQRRYFTVPYGPYYIWGATARMLRVLADRMTNDADQS